MKINTNLIKRILASFVGNLTTPIWLTALILPITYTAIGFYDAWRHINKPPEISAKADYERAASKLKSALEQSPSQESMSTELEIYATSAFTTRTIRITAYRLKFQKDLINSSSIEIEFENSYRFEAAEFAFAAGAWLIALYLLNWAVNAVKDLAKIWSDSHNPSVDFTAALDRPQINIDAVNYDRSTKPPSATEVLLQDVVYSRQSANKAQLQAAILVVSGVSMALLGVVVFFFSLPEVSELRSLEASERVQVSLIAALRPAATLFFIEAVAWFLLRQYRLVSIDFKEYLGRSAVRTDVLASVQLVEGWKNTDMQQKVLISLLGGNTTNSLKDGETTVSLEYEKIGATNPIWQLVDSLVKKIPDINQK